MALGTAISHSVTANGHTVRFTCDHTRILNQLEHIRNDYAPETYIALHGDNRYLSREEYATHVDELIVALDELTTYESMVDTITTAPRQHGARLWPGRVLKTVQCKNSIHMTDWGEAWQYWALQVKAVNTWKIELRLLRLTEVIEDKKKSWY